MWSTLKWLLGVGAAPTETPKVDPDSGASSVVPPVVKPLVQGSGRERIVTPYRADAFERRLRRLGLLGKHPQLPARIRGGFPMGKFSPLKKTYVPDNHVKRPEHLAFIRKYVSEQVALKRMEGPYDERTVKSILRSDFMTSPLFVIDKSGSPAKFRLVQDCSHKNEDGFSVNDSIEAEDFPTEWGNAASVAQIVTTSPPGTQAATLDIDSAFRNIPILPKHKPYLVIQVQRGEYYIDHVCPFGVASGTGVQAQMMNAIVDILVASIPELTVRVWVDDVIAFRKPSGKDARGEWTYDHDIENIFDQTRDLGVPWKLGKCFRYADRVVYVGFLWNLRDKCVSVPEKKLAQFIAKLDAFCKNARTTRVSLKDSQAVMGTLSHLTFVYTKGRTYLLNLTAFIATFSAPEETLPLPDNVKKDLRWWQTALKKPFSRSLAPRSTKHDPGVAVCVSVSWGIGLIIGEKWAAWQLVGDWKSEGRDIDWVGTVALELTCLYLEALGLSNADIIVHNDDVWSASFFRRGKSKNPHTNLSIRRIEIICTAANLILLPKYVNKKKNLAEPLSRGILGRNAKRLSAQLEAKFPAELRQFLKRA